MVWTSDYAGLGVGALLAALCASCLLQIARSGLVKGRMGGAWSRRRRPATYWLSAASLAAGLAAGVFLFAAGLGASDGAATAIAGATAAGALLAIGRYGRAEPPPR